MDKSLKPFYMQTFKIAWPCIIETMLKSAVFIIDALMVGHLGASETAAVGVNQPVNWFINSFSTGIAIGASVLVAMHYGAGNINKAKNVARQAVFSAILWGAFISFAVFNLSGYIPELIGVESDVKPDAVYYLKTVSLSLCFHFAGYVCSGILRGAGKMKAPMILAIFVNIINICGNIFFIYPSKTINTFLGAVFVPGLDLGVKGAAIATAIAQTAAGLALIIILFDKKRDVYIWLDKSFRFEKNTIIDILKLGVPTAFERGSVHLGMVFFQSILSGLGTKALSAHYLSTIIESVAFMPAEGFSTASTTLVGQSIGAGKRDDALKYSRVTIRCGLVIGTVCGVVFFLFAERLFGFFTNDAEVIRMGSEAFRVMAAAEPILCMCIVMIGVLRGAGDTKAPFLTVFTGMWGVRQVCAWFFAYKAGLGLTGAFIGMTLDILVRFVLLSIRYRRKKWLYEVTRL